MHAAMLEMIKHAHLDGGGVDAAVARGGLTAASRQHAAAKRGLAQDNMPDDADDDHPDQQHRNMEEVRAAEDRDIIVVEDRHRLGLRQPHRHAPRDTHHRQRGQEGWDADARRQGSIDEADHKARPKAGENPGGQPPRVHRHRGRHRGEARDHADREVYLAGREHERHRHGHDCDHRGLAADVQKIVRIEKSFLVQRRGEDQEDRDETDVDDVLTPVVEERGRLDDRGADAGASDMGVRLLQGLGELPLRVLQPRAFVVGGIGVVEFGARAFARNAPIDHHDQPIRRGQQFRQLGRNDDDRLAALGEIADQRDDLRLGADVDPGGGLIENENSRLGEQPFADHDLLLVAAREGLDREVARGGL